MLVARISAEVSASADLNEVCHWLIACQYNPVRLDADRMPALGRHSWLRVALPITAPRAVLCTLWLVEEVKAAGCLLAGTLRFVAHPTSSDIRLSFDGRTAATPRPGCGLGQGDNAARQLLELIAASIERPRRLDRARMGPQTIPLSAAG
ncbi:MAG: hypothetical protein ACYDA0_01130 [Candidatus Dormibacteraceae bacterium]